MEKQKKLKHFIEDDFSFSDNQKVYWTKREEDAVVELGGDVLRVLQGGPAHELLRLGIAAGLHVDAG